jgi:uncharacterized membrane protein YphA (DoxX/SURF4 family)
LLRVTVGITAAVRAWLFVASATNTDLLAAVPAVALVVCGLALAVGIFTPMCSALVGVSYALMLLAPFGEIVLLPRLDSTAALVGMAAAVGLALLGPGAFSIDARLFGRRAIFIRGEKDVPWRGDSRESR